MTLLRQVINIFGLGSFNTTMHTVPLQSNLFSISRWGEKAVICILFGLWGIKKFGMLIQVHKESNFSRFSETRFLLPNLSAIAIIVKFDHVEQPFCLLILQGFQRPFLVKMLNHTKNQIQLAVSGQSAYQGGFSPKYNTVEVSKCADFFCFEMSRTARIHMKLEQSFLSCTTTIESTVLYEAQHFVQHTKMSSLTAANGYAVQLEKRYTAAFFCFFQKRNKEFLLSQDRE